jgi:hypothetical protein
MMSASSAIGPLPPLPLSSSLLDKQWQQQWLLSHQDQLNKEEGLSKLD